MSVNLHDKWVTQDWYQLWADDTKAFIILRTGDNSCSMVIDSQAGIVSEYEDLTVPEAFDQWNDEINRHLNYRKLGRLPVRA